METPNMDWIALFRAAAQTVAAAAPVILEQHWNGKGTNGKLNNAVQILSDVTMAAGSIAEAMQKSDATKNVDPALAAHAESLSQTS
jgi:hypothetical protein